MPNNNEEPKNLSEAQNVIRRLRKNQEDLESKIKMLEGILERIAQEDKDNNFGDSATKETWNKLKAEVKQYKDLYEAEKKKNTEPVNSSEEPNQSNNSSSWWEKTKAPFWIGLGIILILGLGFYWIIKKRFRF